MSYSITGSRSRIFAKMGVHGPESRLDQEPIRHEARATGTTLLKPLNGRAQQPLHRMRTAKRARLR